MTVHLKVSLARVSIYPSPTWIGDTDSAAYDAAPCLALGRGATTLQASAKTEITVVISALISAPNLAIKGGAGEGKAHDEEKNSKGSNFDMFS